MAGKIWNTAGSDDDEKNDEDDEDGPQPRARTATSMKRRNRAIARPRQIAMALAKELTERSYPEIGDAFGGKDHTTVLHACKRIKELRETDTRVREDYANLLRILTA